MRIATFATATVLCLFALAAAMVPGCTGQAGSHSTPSKTQRAIDPLGAASHSSGLARETYRVNNLPSADVARLIDELHLAPGTRSLAPTLAANEELWIIQRQAIEDRGPADDEFPGCGALMTRLPGATEEIEVPVPLKHTSVHASITGFIASVQVTQQFHNPFSSKIEAVYVFPLPENAAVSEFVMTIGERRIRGIIREREEAQRIYQEARSQGYRASILTQERPNIFTQSVANIEPGKQIDIDIRYFHTLAYYDGAYEFVFPMVVGPRFNPPGTTDGVAAMPRGRGGSGQPTEVQYLRPSERSGHDVSLRVDIDAGVAIERIQSRSHVVGVRRDRENHSRAAVILSDLDAIPNKDFVLRYTVAGEGIKSALITQPDPRGEGAGGHFALMIVPPADLRHLPRTPLDMVFVIDRSGSMSGPPLQQVKAATSRALRRLERGDTFHVIDFSESVSQMGEYALEANRQNIQSALRYVDSLSSGGGTYMLPGMRAALALPHDGERLRFITFLTDGYIGNEADVLGELAAGLGSARTFGFGVGSAPNRHLIDSMSRMGRGAVAYLGHADPATDVMDLFMERISRPALTGLTFEFSSGVSEIQPSRPPDLFVGRPVIITGRYEGLLEAVRISGRAGGRDITIVAQGDQSGSLPTAAPLGPTPLAAVWARMKITDITERSLYEPALRAEAPDQIRRLALDHGLMSPYTAFVAVDSLSRTEGEFGTTVAVPVPAPEGVRYDTTVTGEQPVRAPQN